MECRPERCNLTEFSPLFGDGLVALEECRRRRPDGGCATRSEVWLQLDHIGRELAQAAPRAGRIPGGRICRFKIPHRRNWCRRLPRAENIRRRAFNGSTQQASAEWGRKWAGLKFLAGDMCFEWTNCGPEVRLEVHWSGPRATWRPLRPAPAHMEPPPRAGRLLILIGFGVAVSCSDNDLLPARPPDATSTGVQPTSFDIHLVPQQHPRSKDRRTNICLAN